MIRDIKNRKPAKAMEKTYELRRLEGGLKDLSIYKTDNGNKLILRNSSEILIPQNDRKRILELLHVTHLETESMKRLARGKFFWPKMTMSIEELYKTCEVCQEESNSKVHKKAVVIPEDLTMLAPAERICMDYATYEGRKYMIIKDVSSGFIDVKSTKDQTTQEATRCVHEWSYTFGIPHALRTDGGPAFKNRFQEYVDSLGIEHTASSPYNPQSNGLAERGVRQIKDVLRKIKKKPTKDQLREWVFMINNHVQSDGSGTAAQRFFRRGVRTLLPNSIVREVDHRQLIQKRHEKQVKIATAKGRTSKDVFVNGDKVRVQDHNSGRSGLSIPHNCSRTPQVGDGYHVYFSYSFLQFFFGRDVLFLHQLYF